MIFELVTSIDGNPILRFNNNIDSWDCLSMLDACFNSNNQTYGENTNYCICCASGYENGVLFWH